MHRSRWRKTSETVAKLAPSLGLALAGPAGAVVGSIIGRKFGGVSNDSQLAAIVEANPKAREMLSEIESAHAAEIAKAEIEAEAAASAETNKTLRAMTQSGDGFVKRAPAMFLYMLGFTWVIQMSGLTFLAGKIIYEGGDVSNALLAIKSVISEIATLWGFALAVAGVGIHADRKCKEAENGKGGQGAMARIMQNAFGGSNSTK